MKHISLNYTSSLERYALKYLNKITNAKSRYKILYNIKMNEKVLINIKIYVLDKLLVSIKVNKIPLFLVIENELKI